MGISGTNIRHSGNDYVGIRGGGGGGSLELDTVKKKEEDTLTGTSTIPNVCHA